MPRVLMETGSCSQLFQRTQTSCSAPAPRSAPTQLPPSSGYTVARAPQGWGLEHPGLPAPTHNALAPPTEPPRSTHTYRHTDFCSPPSPGSFPLKLEEHNLPAEPRRGSYTACHSHITL